MSRLTGNHAIDARIDALKDTFDDFVKASAYKLRDIEDIAEDQAHRTGKLIRRHPIAAVAIAFGIGYLAMRILRR